MNKYIAHSTTPESKFNVSNEDGIEGTLAKVLNAHEVIYETVRFIGDNLMFCGFGGNLSWPQYGQFGQFNLLEYLDEPMASKETIGKLRGFWGKYRRETERWSRGKE